MNVTDTAAQNRTTDDGGQHLFEARDLALGGLFGALGIVVPIVFHAAGPKAGAIFLPMYLPILALGLLASWEVAVIVGCATPLISAALTGMPPLLPTGLLMVFELAALAVTASLICHRGYSIMAAVIGAIIAARIVGAGIYAGFGSMLGFENEALLAWVAAGILTSWPGILLQLSVVPGAVYLIEQTSVIGPRDSDTAA